MTREELWKSDGVEWRVEGKICVENAARVQLRCFGKSASVGWRVAGKIRGELRESASVGWKVDAKNPGELRRSAGVDGKLQERFTTNF